MATILFYGDMMLKTFMPVPRRFVLSGVVLTFALLSTSVCLAAAKDKLIDPTDTPNFVREGINGTHLADRYAIKKIVYGERDGKMAYEIEFDKPDGPNPRIRIFDSSTIVIQLPPLDTPD